MRRKAEPTISELRKTLAEKEAVLAKLEEKQSALQSELAAVNQDITRLVKGAPKKRRARRKRGRKAAASKAAASKLAAKPARRATRRRRGRGPVLREAIHTVLADAKEPMAILDIAQGVLKVGYKTKSKDMRNLISQAIYTDKLVVKTAPGRFRLKNGRK